MYNTTDDLYTQISRNDLIRLLNDENLPADEIDLDVSTEGPGKLLSEIISSAAAEIDGYLAGRYQLPLAAVPARIKDISVDIVIYNCFRRRIFDLPDSISDIYKSRLKDLDNIRKGTITLDIPLKDEETGGTTGIRVAAPSRIITDGVLEQYRG